MHELRLGLIGRPFLEITFDFIMALRDCLRQQGPLSLTWVDPACLRELARRCNCWCILVPEPDIDHDFLRSLDQVVVARHEDYAELGYHIVGQDQTSVGWLAVDHLSSVCSGELCYLCRGNELSQQRWQGFAASCEHIARPHRRLDACADPEDLLRQIPPESGVLAYNDRFAGRLLHAALIAGRPIPTDLAILGVDNTLPEVAAGGQRAGLSSIAMPVQRQAERIAQLLLRLRMGVGNGRQYERLPAEHLHARDSTLGGQHASLLQIALEQLRHYPETDLHQLAQQLECSTRTLERIFHDHLRSSPAVVRRRFQFEKAVQLLDHSDMPIRAIANVCGFRSLSAFHRSFSKHFGLPPGAWRERQPSNE
jgi:AraC-like DNA-binding protein